MPMRLQRLCVSIVLFRFILLMPRALDHPGSEPAPPCSAGKYASYRSRGKVPFRSMMRFRWRLQHNHNLLAARTDIQQNQAEETTANLRPNPVLLGDSQFLPIFQPSQFSADYIDNTAQFDLGVSYLFERGKKRQHRLQAAKDRDGRKPVPGCRQRTQSRLQCCFAVHQC